jgi:hypothetical protein
VAVQVSRLGPQLLVLLVLQLLVLVLQLLVLERQLLEQQ